MRQNPSLSPSQKKELDEESRRSGRGSATIEESSEAESGDDPHIAGELGPDHDDPYHDDTIMLMMTIIMSTMRTRAPV